MADVSDIKKTDKSLLKTASPVTVSFLNNIAGLKRYLSGFLNSSHDVEDVLHESFIRAVEAEKSGNIRSPISFLYKVTKNAAINYNNQACYRLTELQGEMDEYISSFHAPSMEEQLALDKEFTEFCNAVKALPAKCRRAFVLRRVYGLTNREIAIQLNISVSTVEKHLAKGLWHCRKHMERKGYLIEKDGMTAGIKSLK